MVVFFLHHFLVVVLSFSNLGEGQDECTESRCRHHHGPAIRFPFRHKGHQPNHCGYPGFDLYCNDKGQTVLELPSSVKLLVKNINYTSGEILLHDQHGCLPRQLQSLNLSASPFQFRGEPLADYTLFNCSPTNKYRKDSVPCLSAHGYHVHAVESFNSITRSHILSCRKLYGFSSAPYEVFNKKFVLLYWSYPKCGACEEKSQRCRVKKNNSTNPETECIPKLDKGATSKWPQVTGGIFFLVLILVIIPGGFSYLEKKEEKKKDMIEKFLEDFKALKPTRYSYADIKNITNQFKDKLGQGGYGTVFKGKISNKIPVAVKVLDNNTGSGEEFKNEVGTIGRIHHVNVVRLVGFCADGIRRALVYEFLPNESLEKFIFSMDYRKHSLRWEKLQDIAIGIAKGIEYLHQGCDQRILHFDIKPHNILLDHNFNPKISDFGLAKLCSKGQSVVSMTAARGTMGYIAPEVLSRNIGNVSYKSDVYSFGMLLLEMVGGRKNTDIRVENTSQVYFPEWIYNHLNQGEELQIRIKEDGDAKIAKKLTIVGLWCIQWYPMERPSMKVVVQMLEGDGDNLAMPPNPFASTIQSTITPERPFSRGLAVISEAN